MVSDSDQPGRMRERRHQDGAPPQWLYAESLRIITANCREVHPRLRDSRTSHPFWAVYLAPTAELSFRLDDGSDHQVTADDCVLIPPWLPFRHRFAHDRCPHCYVLFVLPHIPPQLGLQACGGPIRLGDRGLVAAHRAFAAAAPRMSRLERALHGQVVAALAMLALARALPPGQRELLTDPHHASARLQPALAYIEQHLARTISVADLAKLLGCGDDHCSRLFRRHLGQTPISYIIARRVQRAGMLMTDTALGLDAIARRCGFANRQYLSRQFQRHLGVAPSRFRAQAHGELTS
jgi:AraC-like DNA-binding protein